ncbi:hypothetical protein I4U23_018622 [Adineta vaga]|nr:hypothetical protein I4U23_018622 [Adineta vaga]
MSRRSAKRPRFSVGGQPVFENEDSSNHSGLGVPDYDENSLSQQSETPINNSDQHNSSQHQFVPDRFKRIQQSFPKSSNEDNTNLNTCLDHLLRSLILKDKEGFFQYPVTDQLAPGYSQIITHPMDFSTMKKKITHDEYSNILEFSADFELMCNNAMKYNRQETVYWQAAKKLLSTGTKLMAKEKLVNLRRTMECFSHLTEREFGFRFDVVNHTNEEQMDTSINENDNQTSTQRKLKVGLKLPKYYEKLPTLLADEEEDEELSPEEILSQAQQAAQCTREKLSLRRPISAYTLSCQRTNGTTSLRFLNQDDLNQQQSQTRTITIGELSNMSSNTGASSSQSYHSHTTPIVNENEKRNHLLPRYFLDYGSFSSHAPQYDSSFTSLSKDDLDLLVHTYGSEFSAQHAISLVDYVKDSGDIALDYVDRFLSSLTNERNGKDGQESNTNVLSNGSGHVSSNDSVKSELQIAMNGNLQHQLDMKLDENAKLLVRLRQAQYDRLSQPANKIHQIINSSQQQSNEPVNEYDLADKVLHNLSDMTHLTSSGPEQVISADIIHHNLGIVENQSSTIESL